MGLDMYIEKRKRFTDDSGKVQYQYEELAYWRKFWDLMHALPFPYGESTYAKDIVLSREDVESIRSFCMDHKNYFGTFSGVENLCEILSDWDKITKDGQVVFHADW